MPSYKEYYFRQILSACRVLDELTISEKTLEANFNEEKIRKLFLTIGVAATALGGRPLEHDTFTNRQITKMSVFNVDVLDTHTITPEWVSLHAEWLCSSALLERLSFASGYECNRLRLVLQSEKDKLDGLHDTLDGYIRKSWLSMGAISAVAFVFVGLLVFDWKMILPAAAMLLSSTCFIKEALMLTTIKTHFFNYKEIENMCESDILFLYIGNVKGNIKSVEAKIKEAGSRKLHGYSIAAAAFMSSLIFGILFAFI